MNEMIWNATVEQPVECDVLLPDYCPDMVRILRCAAEPAVGQAVVTGNQLTIDGVVTIHVYYKSQDRQLCHTEYKTPFRRAIELKTTVNQPMVRVTASTGYFNCRPVNQRRLEMRGTVQLKVQVLSSGEEQVISGAQGAGVQCRTLPMESARMVAQCCKTFTVREDLELGQGKEPIASPIRASAWVTLNDYKVVSGKLIAKGELTVTLLYLCDGQEGKLQTVSRVVPVSQIVDVEGLDEDCICSVSLSVAGCDLQPKADLDGVANMVSLEAAIDICVTACKREEYPVAVDCYCTKYESHCQSKLLSFQKVLAPINETIAVGEMLELPEDVVSITHLWAELADSQTSCKNGSLILSGKLRVCMFGCYQDGELEYFDKIIEFSKELPLEADCESCRFDLDYRVTACSCNVGSQIDLRCEVTVCGMAFCQCREQVLTAIAVDEQKPVVRENSSCLTVYFAQQGESVWGIAKRYNTSPAMVMEENDLEEDTLPERRMLLIPVI